MNFFSMAEENSTIIPVYINLVRYPVDRFISHFYFRRNGDNRQAGPKVSEENYKKIVEYVSSPHTNVIN